MGADSEAKLIQKLRLIEALFAGATTSGEKIAAERAKQRILQRLKSWEQADPPVEYRFTMGDMWSRKVFVALLRRYEIKPYRYGGQRYTTVMARVSKRFVDETLWPEFREISGTLETYLSEVTERVVSQVIHQDSSEADVVDAPRQLSSSVDERDSVPAGASVAQDRSAGGLSTDSTSSGLDPSSNPKKRKRKKRKKRKRR